MSYQPSGLDLSNCTVTISGTSTVLSTSMASFALESALTSEVSRAKAAEALLLPLTGGTISGNLVVSGTLTSTTPDTSDNSTLVATTAWVKSQNYLTSATTRTREILTISSDGQSAYTFDYTDSSTVDVFLNGLLLNPSKDYTCSSNTTITLSTTIATNIKTTDILIAYKF